MHTHTVTVGSIPLGGDYPVVVQTMCNTDTLNVEASVQQCLQLAQAGSQIIRLTTQGQAQVAALATIKARLHQAGCDVPLVADVHFSAATAMAAATVAHKVRINPGNFSKDPQEAASLLQDLIAVCRQHHTALRIGINHGSMPAHIVRDYGNTPEGMCQGAMEYLRLCTKAHFDQVVVSLKASNTRVMTAAYRLLAQAMEAEGMSFPLHLGVTEAGNGRAARLKSAAAMFTLLQEGLGDTLRVSLTESPVEEVIFGLHMVNYLKQPFEPAQAKDWDDALLAACYHFGPGLLNQTLDPDRLSLHFPFASAAETQDFCDDLLQATRCRFTKPEYISCPGCGRTLYDLETTVQRVKEATAHLKGCTIAIMGCIVNGPGEMADADYGYVGQGAGQVTLYKGKSPVERGIPQEQAVEKLVALIESDHRSGSGVSS